MVSGILCVEKVPTALAQVDLAKSIQNARKFLALGELARMEEVLQKAEEQSKKPDPKQPPQAKDNARLWLDLLWGQFHQILGTPPPFARLQIFDNKEQVHKRIADLERALQHTQQAIFYLGRYSALFRTVLKRSNTHDALTLVSTANRIQILHNTTRTMQNRIPLLEGLLRDWDRESPAQRQSRIKMLLQVMKQSQKDIAVLRKRQQRIQTKLQRQGKAIVSAQQILQRHQADLQQRKHNGRIVVWIGAGALTLGVAGTGAGVGWEIYKNVEGDAKKLNEYDTNRTVWLAVGIPLLATGVAMVLIGHLIQPKLPDQYKGVYRSHKDYLDWEERELNQPSSASSMTDR
jgi:tetratricopeptide (TPR) repeat protein